MEDQIKSLQAALDKQAETIEKLTALVNSKATEIVVKAKAFPTVPKEPVLVDDIKCRWNVAVFQMPGSIEQITAEEASTDEALMESILAIPGQGLLTVLV